MKLEIILNDNIPKARSHVYTKLITQEKGELR